MSAAGIRYSVYPDIRMSVILESVSVKPMGQIAGHHQRRKTKKPELIGPGTALNLKIYESWGALTL